MASRPKPKSASASLEISESPLNTSSAKIPELAVLISITVSSTADTDARFDLYRSVRRKTVSSNLGIEQTELQYNPSDCSSKILFAFSPGNGLSEQAAVRSVLINLDCSEQDAG